MSDPIDLAQRRAYNEARIRRVTTSPFHRRHDGAAIDYAESEPVDAPMRGDMIALTIGVSLGIWAAIILGAIKFWPVVSLAVRGIVG